MKNYLTGRVLIVRWHFFLYSLLLGMITGYIPQGILWKWL